MSMYKFEYSPISEEDSLKDNNIVTLLDPGIYDFTVIESIYKISNSGNHIIQLKLLINYSHTVFDYLVSKSSMEWKTRHFCQSVGLLKEYEKKEFNENICLNKFGKVKLYIQKGSEKPTGGFYKDKNSVEDYIYDENDSDIPF